MKKVEIFTDGACSPNPGAGGWAAILRYNGTEKELCGGEHETTNNRMELTAVVEALNALKYPCEVTIYSDSEYIVNAIKLGWVESWKKRGWKNSKKEPTPNTDLWEMLLDAAAKHSVEFIWVRGHDGHPENERCDALAVGQRLLHVTE